MLKRFFGLALIVIVILVSAVPAFAETSYEDLSTYVPEIPYFVTVGGQGKNVINIPFDTSSTAELRMFFADFYDGPYMITISQNWNPLTVEFGKKTFWIDFIKFDSFVPTGVGSFRFRGWQHSDGLVIPPMQFFPSIRGYHRTSYFFDDGQMLTGGVNVHHVGDSHQFSYVIGSSPLSGSDPKYPYHNTLAGRYTFDLSAQFEVPRFYNWWLGYDGEIPLPPDINVDTDGDGKPDINIDTDGDGKPDINIDTDDDKIPDINIDTDDDGEPDINIDTDGDGKPDINIDTNGDKKPDINVDTDGDRKPDINIDTNGDGKPDINIDKDGDGRPDVNIDTDGDGKPDINVDTNGDGKPDINIDTDNDGSPDVNIDTDGDGKANINIDTNGNGKPNINIDTNGDGKPDINIDTDGDGKPDINIDTDSDKKPDINIDTDGDKKPNVNIDTNGDMKPDINIDTNGDGKADTNIDSDGDGKPDINVKPGGSGGGSSGSGGAGSGGFDDWFPNDYDDDFTFDGFPIFNPFDYDNYTPPKYNDPWSDYNPLEGHTTPNMPEIPVPNVDEWSGYNPFINPYK